MMALHKSGERADLSSSRNGTKAPGQLPDAQPIGNAQLPTSCAAFSNTTASPICSYGGTKSLSWSNSKYVAARGTTNRRLAPSRLICNASYWGDAREFTARGIAA